VQVDVPVQEQLIVGLYSKRSRPGSGPVRGSCGDAQGAPFALPRPSAVDPHRGRLMVVVARDDTDDTIRRNVRVRRFCIEAVRRLGRCEVGRAVGFEACEPRRTRLP
jgi:hypothetical protein